MGFNKSFVDAIPLGMRAYENSQANARAEAELAMRQEAAGRERERFDNEKTDRKRVSDAYDAYGALDTQQAPAAAPLPSNMRQAGTNALADAGYADELNNDPVGMGMRGAPPKAAAGVGMRTNPNQPTAPGASPLQREQALGRIASASRDVVGMRASMDNQNKMSSAAALRTYATEIKDAYDNNPAAYAELVRPMTAMMSSWPGAAASFTSDPRTGAIIMHPYSGAKPQEVPYEEALPYLLTARQMMSEHNNDPIAAAKALGEMSNAKRDRMFADTARSLTQASTVGKSVNEANQTSNQRITANAAASNAATNRRSVDSQIAARDKEDNRKDASIAAISASEGALNAALKSGDKKAVTDVLTKMSVDSARTSGDTSKLLLALRDRAAGLTGARKPIGKIEKTDDGVLVFDTDNKLTEFLTPSGLSLPPGTTEAAYTKILAEAEKVGVKAELGREDNGERAIWFLGTDGKHYPTLNAAMNAKAPAEPKPAGGLKAPTASPLSDAASRIGNRGPMVGEGGRLVDTSGARDSLRGLVRGGLDSVSSK